MPINTKFAKCKEKNFTEKNNPDFNRKHTKDSIFLIHKWICEGMSPKIIGSILNRSEKNVLTALRYPLNEGELLCMRRYFSRFNEREINFSEESCTELQKEDEND